jgi:hypothetical protein
MRVPGNEIITKFGGYNQIVKRPNFVIISLPGTLMRGLDDVNHLS